MPKSPTSISFLDLFRFQISFLYNNSLFPILGLDKMDLYTYVCTHIFEADILMEIKQRHALTDCIFNKVCVMFELPGEHRFRPVAYAHINVES